MRKIFSIAPDNIAPLFITAILLLSRFASSAADTNKIAGLSATFKTAGGSDVTATPNVSLFVSAGQPATPFLAPDKFTTVWNGFIAVDLRGDYSFQAEMNGTIKVEVNGQTILDLTTNGTSELSKSIRLGKGGTNTLTVTFTSPSSGDASLRLFWKPRDSFVQPIPATAFTHVASPEEHASAQVRLGRELFIENRCAKCHAGDFSTAIPELAMDAPSFDEIGARRNRDWMAQWIQNPKAMRPTAHMPQLFGGEKAKEQAESIASYLASLTGGGAKTSESQGGKGNTAGGKKLFETLHCAACHDTPGSNETDPKKVPLKFVASKFSGGALTEFLKQPDANYAWIHMPRFTLSDAQRLDLAAYLIGTSAPGSPSSGSSDPAVVEQGKALVQKSGCLNCHGGKVENQFATKALKEISDWNKGCLADTGSGNAPRFGFSPEERDALRAFAATDRSSLTRHVEADFSERYSRILNCRNCHGQFEGFPKFEILGEKLKPEWMAKFIGGEVDYKPRPWLEAQMPGFPKFAVSIAKGLATEQGFAATTPNEPAVDHEGSNTGHRLVSSPPKGFACISCHSVGSFGATQVFEAPGINLMRSGERLQPSYFRRWLRNPPMVDPQTKMPAYFDEEGKSPIADVYDGDAYKQINALWQYVRLGKQMPLPTNY